MSGYFQKRMLKYPLYGLIAATIILSVITFFFFVVAIGVSCCWRNYSYGCDVLF